MADYWLHSKYIQEFKAVCDAHPDLCDYVSAGKTFIDTDMWIFRVGNPDGGPVLFDGCLHGMEDMGSQVGLCYLNWLLTSGEPKAEEILERNYTLLMPVINNTAGTQYDNTWGAYRGNRNLQPLPDGCPYGGVDLNRNFIHGWTSNPSCCNADCCGGPGAHGYYSACYHGKTAGSEPETQVMRQVFNDYLNVKSGPRQGKKSVYVNTHFGGGPFFYPNSHIPSATISSIKNRIRYLAQQTGVETYPMDGTIYGDGYIANDAYDDYGAISYTFEMWGSTTHWPCGVDAIPLQNIICSCVFPIVKPILFALSEYCAEIQGIDDHVNFTININ